MISNNKPEVNPRPAQNIEHGAYHIPESRAERPVQDSVYESQPRAPEVMPTYPASQPVGQVASQADVSGYRQIENILEEDLADIYFKLTPIEQASFKVKGEEAAKAIAVEMTKPKLKIKRIIDIIHSWLKTISGLNSFFLEQITKIKTDKLLALKNRHGD